jgi:hypothetical protein
MAEPFSSPLHGEVPEEEKMDYFKLLRKFAIPHNGKIKFIINRV